MVCPVKLSTKRCTVLNGDESKLTVNSTFTLIHPQVSVVMSFTVERMRPVMLT